MQIVYHCKLCAMYRQNYDKFEIVCFVRYIETSLCGLLLNVFQQYLTILAKLYKQYKILYNTLYNTIQYNTSIHYNTIVLHILIEHKCKSSLFLLIFFFRYSHPLFRYFDWITNLSFVCSFFFGSFCCSFHISFLQFYYFSF